MVNIGKIKYWPACKIPFTGYLHNLSNFHFLHKTKTTKLRNYVWYYLLVETFQIKIK